MRKKIKKSLLITLAFILLLDISYGVTSSNESYNICIGQQGSLLSSPNYKLLFTLSSPLGNSSSSSYRLNLGFIAECIEGICCDFNSICNVGETQENCPSDCKTEVSIRPSNVYSEQEVNITIIFSDSRYKHKIGRRIEANLKIDSINWVSSLNCFSDVPIVLKSSENYQTCNWDYGKSLIECGNYDGNMTLEYEPEKHKVKIEGKCKLPPIGVGYHILNLTVSFY